MCRQLFMNFIIITTIRDIIFSLDVKRRVNFPFDDTPIHTEYVDTSNLADLRIRFNLTEDQIKRISNGLSAAKQKAEINNNGTELFRDIKEYRINNIFQNILNAVHGGGMSGGGTVVPSENSGERAEYPLHEMAAYPKCNAETSEASWLQDNNVTIQFSHSLFEARGSHLNLDSAILRLYKINLNASDDDMNINGQQQQNDEMAESKVSKSKRCTDPLLDSQIRVTVSIVQQLRRNKRGAVERKKRICNTIMMNASKTVWIEIDIKRAIYIWESVSKQVHQHQHQ